jgi:hypothetical protein
MYHTYHALQARSSGPEPACGSVQRHCLCLLAISGSAGWLLEADWMSVVQKAGDGSPARRVRQHTGLVSELWTVVSPAPRTIRGCLMVLIIIPHLRSMPRWLGRPQRLTRRSALPVGEGHHEVRLLIGCFPQSVHRRFVHCTPRGRLDCTRARAVRVPLLDGRIETSLSYYKRE